MTRNPTYYPGDLRAALVDAAVALLRDEGMPGLSLRAAARRAGVSHAAPAHHFGDRAGLLAAVAVRGHHALAERMAQAAADADGDPVGALAAGVVAYADFARERPELFGPMFRRELWGDHAPAVEEVLRGGFAGLREVVVAAQAGGAFPGVDADAATVMVWSVAQGLASLQEHGALDGLAVDVVEVARVAIRA